MGHMGQGHDKLQFGLESLPSWRLHDWDQRAFCVAPAVHVLGSVWYIAITWLLFLIWRELRLIRMK